MCRSRCGDHDIYDALHRTCCSVSTIRKLIDEAGPEILKRKDVYGRVPLFYAIRRRCPLPVIRTLFDLCPEAILEADLCGDLPLYMLFASQTDPRVLEHCLEGNPSLALFRIERFSGSQTLLQVICNQWMNIQNGRRQPQVRKRQKHHQSNVLPRSKVYSDLDLLNRWRKLVRVVRAAHQILSTKADDDKDDDKHNDDATITIPNQPAVPELHLALELGCLPRAVVAQFIELYPEQASKPLFGKRSMQDNQSCCQIIPKLPLQVAIAKNQLSWTEGLRALVYAHPSALFEKDETNLVPFLQQAATLENSGSSNDDGCNTVYCLLREDPSVVSSILTR